MSGIAAFDEAFDFGAFDLNTSGATLALTDAPVTGLAATDAPVTGLAATDVLLVVTP